MKRKKHTPEQIIRKLREAEAELANGGTAEAVCKKLEITPATYYRWQKEYGGAKLDTVKRLKELEQENQRLKKLVANQALDIAMLKELNEGKW